MKNEGSPQVAAFALRTPYVSGSRAGTRGRRQRFPSNERRDLEGAHRKAGAERTGGGEYSGAGAGPATRRERSPGGGSESRSAVGTRRRGRGCGGAPKAQRQCRGEGPARAAGSPVVPEGVRRPGLWSQGCRWLV